MNPAPPLDCAACGRTISKRRGHNLTEDRRVLCGRCLDDKATHALLWPTCVKDWHDAYDHTPSVAGTRAGVAAALGLWPTYSDRSAS